jgi:selenide,water dikinase
LEGKVLFQNKVPQHIEDIMFDPQTSGGLLLSAAEPKAEELLKLLKETNKTEYAVIGRVKPRTNHPIEVL